MTGVIRYECLLKCSSRYATANNVPLLFCQTWTNARCAMVDASTTVKTPRAASGAVVETGSNWLRTNGHAKASGTFQ